VKQEFPRPALGDRRPTGSLDVRSRLKELSRLQEGWLSVDDGSKIDARSSWERFTGTLGLESAGVLAVTVAECSEQELPVTADAKPYPEHCFIDFSGVVKKSAEKKAKVLASHAVPRGWLFEDTQQSR
jgi:hypothetical protein